MGKKESREESGERDLAVLLDFQRTADLFGYQIPVRFRVGKIDLLGTLAADGTRDPWLRLFVALFATWGIACLRTARLIGHATLELDDYGNELVFKMAGDSILICSPMVGKVVSVDYDELFNAWDSFARAVRDEVILNEPERGSCGWWALISADPPPELLKHLAEPSRFGEREECFTVWLPEPNT